MPLEPAFNPPAFLKKRREIRTLRLTSEAYEEVEQELRRIAHFHCRRSAVIVGFRYVDGQVEMEMEMEPGRLLFEELAFREGPLNALETLRLGRELLLAQIEARQSGYLFSRITPRHVLLRVEDGGREITGGAKLIFPPMPAATWWVSANNTAYVSPEEIQSYEDAESAKCDYRSTLFSIGAVLFYALCHRDPHKRLDGSIDWNAPEIESLSTDFRALLEKMTAATQAARFESLDAVANEFTRLLRVHAGSPRREPGGLLGWMRRAATF